ncbi:MAG: hypothetical protein P8P32_08830 [Akkermansiaceae bacterium]|nr:hypothetical protein [Akkermansiaceae bacterium]
MTESDNYLNNLLSSVENVYEPEAYFFEPFWEFAARLNSLQRYWNLGKDYHNRHTSLVDSAKGDGSAEFHDIRDDILLSDKEYMPEFNKLSTIAIALSLVENLLGTLADDIAKDLGKKVDLDQRPIPYLNKYIMWLVRGCGIEIDIDKSIWKGLDAIREMRNRFIHRINRDIPDQIKKVISEMVSSSFDPNNPVSDDFVEKAFVQLADLVKIIETAYIDFHFKQNP